MAAHVIQQVRDALLAQLQATAALVAVCPNIFLFRERPFDISKTPYLSLQVDDDDETDASIGYPNIEDMMAHYSLTIVT